MDQFKKLNLSDGMLQALATAGFTKPSEIQEKTIPLVLEGKDVIGSSATGSGKTLAFGAGIIEHVVRGSGIQALILVPTRELAGQVSVTLAYFSRFKGLRVRHIYGGVGMGPQIREMRDADIVVATPGRLLDHLKQRTVNLSKVKYLVLDEADRMLDMGFIRDVESIVKLCPHNRQTLLFTATMSRDLEYMAHKYMKEPAQISAGEKVDPAKLHQVYYDVPRDQKFSLLAHLLKLEQDGVVMVFCNTRRNTDKLTRSLGQHGLHARAIHGGLSQNKRSEVLESFHNRQTLILVCTDVAARGLDIKDVSHVYNYDVPTSAADYVHRIGRTARAGKKGIGISFVTDGEHGEFRQICREKNLVIEKMPLPQFETLAVSSGPRQERRFGGGRSRSSGRGHRHDRKSNRDQHGGRGYRARRGGGGHRRDSGFGGHRRDSGFGGGGGNGDRRHESRGHGGGGRFRGSSRSRFSRR